MSGFGQRLKQAIKQKGMNQRELAEKLSVSQQAVSYLTKQDQENSKFTAQIAEILDVSPSWLKYGEATEEKQTRNDGDHLVPFVEWANVGNETPASEKMIICPVPHGPRAYATVVQGRAMHGPSGRCYPEESIIFVDPDKTDDLTNRDRVIARLLDTGDVTFRMFYDDGSEKFLAPLNTDFPHTIGRPFEVIGIIIAGMTI